jgi:hypothetical protein
LWCVLFRSDDIYQDSVIKCVQKRGSVEWNVIVHWGRINPPPERIIWCYKRWQPLFSDIYCRVVDDSLISMYNWWRLRVYIVKVAWRWLSDPRLSIFTEILNYCIYHILVVYSDEDDYVCVYIKQIYEYRDAPFLNEQ